MLGTTVANRFRGFKEWNHLGAVIKIMRDRDCGFLPVVDSPGIVVGVVTDRDVCMARDPKGIHRKAQSGQASTVPGLQASYEAPEHADVVMSGHDESPEAGARTILRALEDKGYVKRLPLAATP